jgi:hypothetical protein
MNIKIFLFFFILSSNLYAEERRFVFNLPDNLISGVNEFEFEKKVFFAKTSNFSRDVSHLNKFLMKSENFKKTFIIKSQDKKIKIKMFINLEADETYLINSNDIIEVNYVKIFNFFNTNSHFNNYQRALKNGGYFRLIPKKKGLYYIVVHGEKKSFNIYKLLKNNYEPIITSCFEKEGIFYNYIIFSRDLYEVKCIKTTEFILEKEITIKPGYEIYHKFLHIKKL